MNRKIIVFSWGIILFDNIFIFSRATMKKDYWIRLWTI